MEFIWSKTCPIPKRERLNKDIRTEIAVIGAGISGILAAHALQNAGHEVVVLEKDRICSGQTGGTTAKITAQHGLFYDKCIRRFGKEKALLFACAASEAIEAYAALAERFDFDFKRENAYIFGNDEDALRRERDAARSLGLPASIVKDPPLPARYSCALCFENQACMHPLKLLRALSEGLEIYENTRVTEVCGAALAAGSYSVRAEKIVFACHFPFVNFPGLYFARMHAERSYLLALEGAGDLEGMWLEDRRFGFSLRRFGDLLLFGGCGHRTGENDSGGRFDALVKAAQSWFPNARVLFSCSAQDCMTADGLPYIGRFSASRPQWFVAAGFGKWGMTSSMTASRLLTDLIENKENPCASLFDPSRCELAGTKKILSQTGYALKGYAERVFRPSEKRSPADSRASRVCTHLGCALHFNPDEQTWDCPCHGSRFNRGGELLNGPAVRDLKKKPKNDTL